MWEKISYHKNKIFAIILVVGVVYWLSVPEEDLDDPYVITVEYDCREIIKDPSDIPTDIVQQCKDLVRELEIKNAPKQSKPSTTT